MSVAQILCPRLQVAAGIMYAGAEQNHTVLVLLDMKRHIAIVLEFQGTCICLKLGLCFLLSLVKLSQEIKYNQLHALKVKPSRADK